MGGALVLAGSGEFLPAMAAVDEEMLRRTPGGAPRVAIVPTAAGAEGRVPFDWIERGVRHFAALGADPFGVPILSRAEADDPGHAAALAGADLVYLSGGNPGWLVGALRGTAAWQAIRGVWDRGGTIAGSSAGAMALAALTVAPPAERGRIWLEPVWRPALGLVPGAGILPHYDRLGSERAGVLLTAAPPGLTILGIDEDTVIFAVGGAASVLGAGTVTVWRGGRATVRRTGDRLDPALVALP
jgi:cyanophycinase